MTIRDTITAEVIWGSLWRASLYGVLLGAAFGGLFGAAFGSLIFPLIGTALGLFFGALTGAVVGLPLGLLDGLLLSWLATANRNAPRPNSRRYQLQARIVCVAGSLLALLSDWALHGLPDPDGFAIYRAYGLVQDLLLPVSHTGGDASPDAITLGALGILVFTPMLMILFASWLTGRFVAGWYAGRICPTRSPGRGA
jgi:hypothetical protein